MKILFIGDIIGEPGRKTVARQVPRLVRERGVACVIANAENAAGGFGVTPDVAQADLAEAGLAGPVLAPLSGVRSRGRHGAARTPRSVSPGVAAGLVERGRRFLGRL